MIKRTRGLGWFLALMLVVVWGCARTYYAAPGAGRPAQAVAVITPDEGVKIHALDGKVVDVKPETDRDWFKYSRIQLRPGKYALTLIPQGIETVKAFTRLTVQVEAGQRYRVRSEWIVAAGGRVGYHKFWVANERTGTVVSDVVESRNPFQPTN
jgi:hypothetical protein